MNGSYDLRLVALSVFIAVIASYTAFTLSCRIIRASGKSRFLWLAGGAFSMGTGIWSMHFIGMLAFRMPIPVEYDVHITLLSLLIAIVVSGFALFMASGSQMGLWNLILSGTVMGAGIASMHYTGMMAMETGASISYDPFLFALSVLIAILASITALRMVSTLQAKEQDAHVKVKVLSALVMGIAIAGMHYTGMAAAVFPSGMARLPTNLPGSSWLAGTIGLSSFMILTIALILSLVDSHLASRTAGLVGSLKAANEKLHYLALHDGLTRLPNRTLLDDRVDQAIRRAGTTGASFPLLFLDIDRFKPVNDAMGHHVGDKLLQEVARSLSSALNPDDTVSRIGGDEFVILLPNEGDPRTVNEKARAIRDAVSRTLEIDGQPVTVSASIGISVYPHDGTDFRTLLVNADSAMYHAKSKGAGNIQFYSAEMNERNSLRIEMENDLRRAIQNEEFTLYYQPKVMLKTGVVESVEALVRWNHPERGVLLPERFIPLAEETGLIILLGKWIIGQACRDAVAWQTEGFPRLRVAVNLSALQFVNPNLMEEILSALDLSGLAPECLELEITESFLMRDPEGAMRTLSDIRKKGVRVAIDDFGTGYSSFSYLKKFPLDHLKIDRSFITDICHSSHDAAIVRTIVTLGHSLNLKVIAEGVENAGQIDILTSMGCDAYQGFFKTRPLPPEELAEILKKERKPTENAVDSEID